MPGSISTALFLGATQHSLLRSMDVAQFVGLVRREPGKSCFVAVLGFFAAVFPEAVSRMFFLLGVGFLGVVLFLVCADDMFGFIVNCVVVAWQWCCGLPARLLVGWRAGMSGR